MGLGDSCCGGVPYSMTGGQLCCSGSLHDGYGVQCCGGRIVDVTLVCCGDVERGEVHKYAPGEWKNTQNGKMAKVLVVYFHHQHKKKIKQCFSLNSVFFVC